MCLSAKTETSLELEWQILAVLLANCSLQSFFENEYLHFVIFCSLMRRLYAFQDLKWAQGSQSRMQAFIQLYP